MEILSEHTRLRAEQNLSLLICTNHGFNGGDGAKKLAEQFSTEANATT
jgi:hypothetical protein